MLFEDAIIILMNIFLRELPIDKESKSGTNLAFWKIRDT